MRQYAALLLGALLWASSLQAEVCQNDSIAVPGGTIVLGSPDALMRDEQPITEITVKPFRIAQFETTLGEAQEFIARHAAQIPASERLRQEARRQPCWPVGGLNWEMARAYCLEFGGDLPTEAQWVRAATFDPADRQAQLTWPTGASLPVAFSDDPLAALMYGSEEEGEGDPEPYERLSSQRVVVQHSLKGRSDIFGMAGSHWEWTRDWYSTQLEATPPTAGAFKVLKGGAFNNADTPYLLRPQLRNFERPTARSAVIGFRCVWNQPEEK